MLSSDKSELSVFSVPVFTQFPPDALFAKMVFTILAVPSFSMPLPPAGALFFEKVQFVIFIVARFWMAPPKLTELLL